MCGVATGPIRACVRLGGSGGQRVALGIATQARGETLFSGSRDWPREPGRPAPPRVPSESLRAACAVVLQVPGFAVEGEGLH